MLDIYSYQNDEKKSHLNQKHSFPASENEWVRNDSMSKQDKTKEHI